MPRWTVVDSGGTRSEYDIDEHRVERHPAAGPTVERDPSVSPATPEVDRDPIPLEPPKRKEKPSMIGPVIVGGLVLGTLLIGGVVVAVVATRS